MMERIVEPVLTLQLQQHSITHVRILRNSQTFQETSFQLSQINHTLTLGRAGT